jgi:hypothetical protein
MAASKDSFSSLEPCTGPPILMGDDTPIQVCGKGVIDLEHGYFQNVLHVPSLVHKFFVHISYHTFRLLWKASGIHSRVNSDFRYF